MFGFSYKIIKQHGTHIPTWQQVLELRSRCQVVHGACTPPFTIDTTTPYCSPSPLPSYFTCLTSWTPEFVTPSPLWCESPIPGRKVSHPFSAASKTWCYVLGEGMGDGNEEQD